MNINYSSQQNLILKIVLFGLLLSLILSACASASRSAPVEWNEMGASQGVAPEAPAAYVQKASEWAATDTTYNMDSQEEVKRLVIKNASLSLIVVDPVKSLERITILADELGGFVVSANLSQTTLSNGLKVPQGSITIRVPAEKLTTALIKIENESDQEPQNKTIDSQDVTREYTDLRSRLRNLEDAEEQLRKIMENAFSTDDVLSVYNRLVEVREQIEVTKGQIQYYEQSAALSSISVTLTADKAVQPLQIGGWQPAGVAKEAVEALIKTLQFLVNAFLWVVIYIVPVILVIYVLFILPFSLFVKFLRKRRAQRKAETLSIHKPEEPHQPEKE